MNIRIQSLGYTLPSGGVLPVCQFMWERHSQDTHTPFVGDRTRVQISTKRIYERRNRKLNRLFYCLKTLGVKIIARAVFTKPRLLTRNLFGYGNPNTHYASTLAVRPSPLKVREAYLCQQECARPNQRKESTESGPVAKSSPINSAQLSLVRVLGLEPRCRTFESYRRDQFIIS